MILFYRKKAFQWKKNKEPKQDVEFRIVPKATPFMQLLAFLESKRNATASKYISKLNPKFGVSENLSRDLLRVFKEQKILPSNVDLCYFVEQVLRKTLSGKDTGKIFFQFV